MKGRKEPSRQAAVHIDQSSSVILKCTGITGTDTVGYRRASMPAQAQATACTSQTPPCSAHVRCWGSQAILSQYRRTADGRGEQVDDERCANYGCRSAGLRSAADFSFHGCRQMCDETEVTDVDNQWMQTRTHLHFSCEVHRAITIGMHRLQMRIMHGCTFLTLTHLSIQWHTHHLNNLTRPQGHIPVLDLGVARSSISGSARQFFG